MKIKEIMRNYICKLRVASEFEIESAIEKASYISFDVFDTLVKRKVREPKEVFRYMESLIEEDKKLSIEGFSKLRIYAEKEARRIHSRSEITISDIYENISASVPEKECLKQMECTAEIALSIANPVIKPFYETCIEKGKSIYFISDMYLPKEVILNILQMNGYRNGKLFVSSESGFTKRNGTLFQFVRESEKIPTEEWLHIGDGIWGDYVVPRRLGLSACLVERNRN